MTGEQTPLLRRPIVSGCARGAVRPNDLGIRLELQARLVIVSVGARVLRKGERQMVPSRLVDASCEVGKGCVGITSASSDGSAQARGGSVRCGRASENGNKGTSGTGRILSVDEQRRAQCAIRGAPVRRRRGVRVVSV